MISVYYRFNKNFVANRPVFYGSAFLVVLLVAAAIFFPHQISYLFNTLQTQVVAYLGWFYILTVAIVLIFCLFFALSSHGAIKLGEDHTEPDFSYITWFAMLFSAGMGIGLVFFGVAEPIMHYIRPPVGAPETIVAAKQAMSITFFHWGLHGWAIYALVGLMLAYFTFRHKLPLTIRSALYPLIGNKIYGSWGNTVDIIAVLGTLFGIAASLGMGVTQINSGLHYLFNLPTNIFIQLLLIAGITAIATVSVISGLNKGVRRLSELNLLLAGLLLMFVFFAGPTIQLLQLFVQNIGEYLSGIVAKTFNLYAYESTGWIGGWTLFYWGWWIAWSPFVGTFIAKISRGRTIREFIFGVLFVPVGFTFMWMTVFGNTAIYLDMHGMHQGVLSSSIEGHVEIAIFKLLDLLPGSMITSFLAVLVVTIFFITSADSGALVIDSITSGGQRNTSVWQRIFWVSMTGIIAATLLVAGGLKTLQIASLISALPFAVVILFASYGLLRSLQLEKMKQMAFEYGNNHTLVSSPVSWRKRLRNIITYPNKTEVMHFLSFQIFPALTNVAEELKKQGLSTNLTQKDNSVALTVKHGEEHDFHYAVHARSHVMPRFVLDNTDLDNDSEKYYRAEVFLTEGSRNYDIMGYTKEEVIADVLAQYDKHMQFLHLLR